MRNKPRIRFKGFTEDWEQRKLGDIATITGGGTPSTNISEYWNGDIDWYSPVEIGEKRYASGSIRKITKLGLEKSSAKILPVGTVLFTSRAGIGNTAILQVEGCTNQGFQSITPNSKELDTYFLYTMTPKLKRYGEVTGAGSTFVEVSGKQMEQMNLMIPSLDEQKHVSQLFKVMDDAITLHQRKLEKLKLAKKALLQKLFPKNGSQFPEIRFKGFTDAWEQRKLSEFVDKAVDNRGKTPPLDENGAHPLIEVAALGGVYPDYSKVEKYLSDDVFNTNLRAYIKKDDILFTTVGSIGLVSLMDSREEAAIAQNIVAFRAKENFLPEYLYALFSNEDNQYKAKRIAMVAVQPSIKVSQLVNVEYMISTNIEEQERIGVFFSSLQSLITLHQRKLDKLQEVKKGLLQKMFV